MKKRFPIYSVYPQIENEEQYKAVVNDSPDNVLDEFAKAVSDETGHEFEGLIVETIIEGTEEVVYAFYILSTRYGGIMYRLIEVTLYSVARSYPLSVKLFAQEPKDNEEFECNNSSELRSVLENFVVSEKTGKVLGFLDTLIKIRAYEENSKSA